MESVISDLSADHKDSFHVVRLNGFIHTDDKIASKEIWRQLGREMEAEDDTQGKVSLFDDVSVALLTPNSLVTTPIHLHRSLHFCPIPRRILKPM